MDVVLTCFFTKVGDPQRNGDKWDAAEDLIKPLAESCAARGYSLVVLNDCFEEGWRNEMEFVTMPSAHNPYIQRWLSYYAYLSNNPQVKRAYLVDATDVIMQENPFYEMKEGKIYVGDEFEELGTDWVRADCGSILVKRFIDNNPNTLLLNAGVIGGSSADLIEVCRGIWDVYHRCRFKARTDMAIFNYVLRTMFNEKIVRGRQVTSIFKAYESKSGAWFKHK